MPLAFYNKLTVINKDYKMKSIIIRGAKNKGKSTTIREVCKRLNSQSVCKLDVKEEKKGENVIKIDDM